MRRRCSFPTSSLRWLHIAAALSKGLGVKKPKGRKVHEAPKIMPAPTVTPEDSSMRINDPVVLFWE